MKLFFYLCFSFVVANVFANEEQLTYVPVGQADIFAEKMLINNLEFEEGISEQKSRAESWYKIIQNNFSFYKHLFSLEAAEQKNAYVHINFEDWAKKDVSYFLAGKAGLKEGKVQLKIKLYQVNKKEVLHTATVILEKDGFRSMAHSTSNDLYKAITGKDSIFGTKIYFASDRTSIGEHMKKELYSMDFDGANIKRLTYHNSIVISPAVSLDGKKIIYSVVQEKGAGKIRNINLNMLEVLTNRFSSISRRDGINSGGVFSKDGKEIYLTLSFTGNADIYAMNLATKKLRRITRHHAEDVDPSIARDGDLMTFLSGRPGRAMIYTLDPRGTEKNVTRVSFVGKFNAAPRFSPDGSEIVFSSWVDERFDLYRIDRKGNSLVRLTKDFGSNEEASFSPDGEFIIFTSQRVLSQKKATQEIYVMTRDGEIVTQITNGMGQCFSPRWAVDPGL